MKLETAKKPFVLFVAVPLMVKILFAVFIFNVAQANAQSTTVSFADLAEKLLPTVVNISSTQEVKQQQPHKNPFQNQPNTNPDFPDGAPFDEFFEDFFEQHQRTQLPTSSLGSGFIINKEKGLIVTNNHVIDGADEIKITLHNDKTISATVIGVDKKTDLAVLKADLKSENIAQASLGNSDVMRVGDWIMAIGNPFGLGGTVTAGIVSARKRDINSGPYDDYIQTDASINRGNSGGPMFNLDGEVIGINTAIFSPTGGSVGIGFAIPSSLAKLTIEQLIEFGHTRRGWLGVRIQDVTDEISANLGLAKPAGALVSEVTKTGPAEKAGIKAGDIILAFNNKPVRKMRNLPRIVAETDINENVNVVVWRNGTRVNLTANIGELEKAESDGLLADNDAGNILNDPAITRGDNIEKIGLTLSLLDDNLRHEFSLGNNIKGMIVTDVNENGDAVKKGISEGDVIIDINQKKATSIDVITSEINNAKKSGRNSVLLLINRQGSIQFVAVKLSEDKKQNDKDSKE